MDNKMKMDNKTVDSKTIFKLALPYIIFFIITFGANVATVTSLYFDSIEKCTKTENVTIQEAEKR